MGFDLYKIQRCNEGFSPSVLGFFFLYCIRFVYIRLAVMSLLLFINHIGLEIGFVVTICRTGDSVVFYQILELGKKKGTLKGGQENDELCGVYSFVFSLTNYL